MQKVLEGLMAKQIMKNEDVLVLREYIGKKYPGATPRERADILANAVHSVIDRHIQEFDEKDRAQIRISLLRRAVSDNHFSIHAGDVLRTCLEIRNDSEDYTTTLTKWVNRHQNVPISRETLLRFSSGQRRYSGDLPEHDRRPFPGSTGEFAAGLHAVEAPREPAIAFTPAVVNVPSGISVFHQLDRKLFHVLAVSLIVLSAFTFQPLRNILVTSFGSTVSSAPESVAAAGTILPEDLLYRTIDTGKLETALNNRKSILAEEPYLSAILQAAREHNVNPLFLFAITGQEQGFVPRTDKDARRMANNPFNVYHSWMEYNTDIRDSARIAANTVTNLSRNRPETVDPVAWINRKYAEDKEWWIGVSRIFIELKKEVDG